MYEIEAIVIHGRKLGRDLGFPTANMAVEGNHNIEYGVYRSSVVIDGVRYRAMSNLGVRPSVDGTVLRLETHVIGYDGDLYGRRLTIRLEEKLRDERKFESLDALRDQLRKDYDMVISKSEDC